MALTDSTRRRVSEPWRTEPAAPVVRRLPRPRPGRARTSDLVTLSAFVLAVTIGLWWQHGGLTLLLGGGTDTLSAIGQVTGLVSALAALGGLILTARPRWMERRYGQDQLLAAHRWFGITTILALLAHAVSDTWAWGATTGGTIVSGLVDLLAHEAWMVAATASLVLFVAIGLTSWRRIRMRIPYESWYFIHLTGYLAVLLGFGHQLTLGSDFVSDPLAFWWWTGLFVVTAVLIAWARLGDLLRSLSRPFYVTAVSREAHGMGSIHVSGRGLRRLRVASGQFFGVRALTSDLWWQVHPFSLSAAPTTAGLRFTVKELGEDSARLLRLEPGTRVLLEGPYGVFTIEQAQGAPVLLVAGGAGIGPIRALLEDCGTHQTPIVIIRVHHESEVAHRAELERMVAARSGRLYIVAGPRRLFARNDPFSPESLRSLAPGLTQRHVFVCGPPSLEQAVMSSARKAGVPTTQIHHERFGV
ncbi:MAG: oxidoreductase [Actinomycetales bacterium]|nr:oxidoreductase [Actinomycetales bacterium]